MKRKVQLYIAGRQVDLGDDSWILYNWTREDMANPTAVINSSSHQIEIPGTCRNNAVFGSAFRLDRRTITGIRYDGTQFDPTRKTPFMLYDDNGAVIESGYCRLDAINTHSRRHAYTITLYGGLGSFFYALAMKDDGTPKTLADLTWKDTASTDVADFRIYPGAATVQDAWTYLAGGTPELKTWWNCVNFAPAYNGLPDDFDTNHAISTGEAYNNVPLGYTDTSDADTYYSYKAGLDCCLLTFEHNHTEWEMGDLRWYLQRPVVSVKAFIAACCDTRNNGGYTVDLDTSFFKDDNPAYASAWWTLGMIATDDRTTDSGIANALAATKSPMDYLVSFCKIYGLLFLWDSSRHRVSIMTRSTFYTSLQSQTSQEWQEMDLSAATYSHWTINSSNKWTTLSGDDVHNMAGLLPITPGERYRIVPNSSSRALVAIIQEQTPASNVAVDFATGYSSRQYVDIGDTLEFVAPSNAAYIYFLQYSSNGTYFEPDIYHYATVSTYTNTPPVDLSDRIDRSQQISVDPVLADSRWYQLGDGGSGQFADQYKRDYGKGYAIQRIDTGYEFDAGTKVLTDGLAFTDAAEVAESDLLYAISFGIQSWGVENVLLLPHYENVTAELWNGDSSIDRTVLFYDWYSNQMPVITYDTPASPGLDWLPKLQLHGDEEKAQDGTDVLVYFTGMKTTPVYQGSQNVPHTYYLTSDNGAMTDLAGGPCWDLTSTGIARTTLPSFRRVWLSAQYILESYDWGVPAVRPVPGIQYPSGNPTAIYDRWWKRYLRDRYDADTRVMTAMVDLRGLPVGQELMRRFYWYDGALWVLNAIRNHPVTTWDLTECEFVKVKDKNAYLLGPGASLTQYLTITPYAQSFTLNPSGETLTLTVDSSSAWTLSLPTSPSWLTASPASGAAGTTTLTITVPSNTTGGRRNTSVVLTNTEGETLTFSIMQASKAAESISLSPSSMTIPAAGTATEGTASRGYSSRVTATSAWAVDSSTIPAWLTVIASTSGLTIKAGANSGSERSASIKVYLTGDTSIYATLAVTQSEGATGTGGITLLDGNGNSNATVAAAGGTLTLYVTIPDGDDWTVAASESWASLSAASGTGDGTLTVTLPNYTGSSDRSCTVTATRDGFSEGAVFYIYQAAPAAATDYIRVGALSDNWLVNNVSISADGDSGNGLSIRASGAWTAATSASWIHPLTAYGAWSGNATNSTAIWFSTDANAGAARTGTIVVTLTGTGLTDTFYVNQGGDGTLTLTAAFSPGSIDSSARTVDLNIQASNGLAWTIDQISSGLTITTTSGTGPATVEVSVSAASAARTLSCRVRNTTYGLTATPSLSQSAPAATDYLRVSPFGTVNVAATDTSVTFSVESSTSWTVTKDSSDTDVTISPSSGSGDATVVVSFDASISNTARTIPITFSGASTINVSIVQAAGEGGLDVTVTPQVLDLSGAGQTATVTLGSTGDWTASKSDSWFTVSPASGTSGQGQTLTVTAGRNIGEPRTGTITVTCGNVVRTVTVNQASDADLEVSSNAVTLGSASGSAQSVTVYASMMWDLYEYNDIPVWLDVSYTSHAGSDEGEALTFTALTTNTSGSSRTASIRIELVDNTSVYQTITVTQASESTLYVSPTATNVDNGVGTGFIHVTCNTDWHITEIETGLTINAAAQSGTGDADVMYAYTANPDQEVRRCRVYFETVDGTKSAMFTLIQEAADAPIVIEPDSALWFEMSEEEGEGVTTLTRVVTCTGDWTAASSASWLSASPSSGLAGVATTVTFTARGSLTEVLHATWTVTCGEDTKTLGAHCLPVAESI